MGSKSRLEVIKLEAIMQDLVNPPPLHPGNLHQQARQYSLTSHAFPKQPKSRSSSAVQESPEPQEDDRASPLPQMGQQKSLTEKPQRENDRRATAPSAQTLNQKRRSSLGKLS